MRRAADMKTMDGSKSYQIGNPSTIEAAISMAKDTTYFSTFYLFRTWSIIGDPIHSGKRPLIA
jgi:hypothetical protein